MRCAPRPVGGAAAAASGRARFPETHISGLGRTHPVTSVRFEPEQLSTQTLEEEQEGRKVLPGWLWRFSLSFLRSSSGTRASRLRVKSCFVKRSEERRRVAFLKREGCQLQRKRTDSGPDMAVSSHFSPLTLRREQGRFPARCAHAAEQKARLACHGCHFALSSPSAWLHPNYDFRVL